MCSLCRLPVAKNHNSRQILNFLGLLYRLPFTDESQIWCAKADRSCPEADRLCRLPVSKNHNFVHILTFGGSCTDPLLPMKVKSGVLQLTHSRRLRVKICFDRFILSPFGGEKNPIFVVFWTSAFSDVDSWRQSEKVEHGFTTTNIPLSHGIKIISVFQHLHGEIGRTNSDV